ncbi:MAG: rod shape-determining protein, partial [Parcubacteria group bacterium]|nr:rod shape-determining protein [Parcubacteria group bacterium]
DIAEALAPTLKEVVLAVKAVLRDTPPELAADVMDRGMIISGGGAQLRNIDELIRRAVGVPAFVAEDPFYCVARGTGIVLENLDIYKRAIQSHR